MVHRLLVEMIMIYNPYDLVPLVINGTEIFGRPFEFDSEVTDNVNMKNAFGNYVLPTKLSTCCPDCGDGIELAVNMTNPPFMALEVNCPSCRPELQTIVDPFMNPIKSDRVREHELDPLLHNPDEQIKLDDTTVKDRLKLNESEVKTEVKQEAKPETKLEVKQEAKPETKQEAKPETKSEVKQEAKPEIEPETKSEVKQEAKPEIEQGSAQKAKPEAKAKTNENDK